MRRPASASAALPALPLALGARPLGARLGKYLAFARVAFREARTERGELWLRSLMYGVLLFVFAQLWRALEEGSAGALGHSAERVIWYLVATEWVMFSVPPVHLELEQQVRRGDVAYALVRPASYLGSLYAQALGRLALRAPVLALVGAVLGLSLAPGATPEPSVLLSAAALLVLGQLVLLSIYVAIGVLAFWMDDIVPVYWVSQKLSFVLGGLMLPLDAYPEGLRRAAALTPFPSILYEPASTLLAGSAERFGANALTALAWLVLIVLLTTLALARAARRTTLNGG